MHILLCEHTDKSCDNDNYNGKITDISEKITFSIGMSKCIPMVKLAS